MNNTEKFFIQFVFKDQKIMGELKKLAASIDKVIRASERQVASSKKTSQEQKKAATEATKAQGEAARIQKKLDDLKAKSAQKSTQKVKSLQQAQIAMLQQITRAYSRGLDGTARYYERIVDEEKNVQRMMRLTQNLREKIERDRLASSKTSRTAESKQAMSERLRQERLLAKARLFEHSLRKSAQYESLDARGKTRFNQDIRNTLREVKTTEQLAMAKKDLTSTLRQLSGATRQAERRLLSLRTVQRGLTNSTRNMIHAYASLFAMFSGVKSINRVGQEFEGINSQLLAATGSQQQAAKEMEYLDKLTSRLGLSLIDTADAYAKLRFTAQQDFDEKTVQALFTGISEFGRVMAVSKERMKWSMMAITQMMSKGTVSNEELRRQLAENLTGSLPIFQRAFERLTGLDGSQLLDYVATGKLLAKDILPLFAEELQKAANASGALDAKLQTTMTQQGRFFKQLETAQKIIFEGGMDEGGAAMFNQLAKGLDESEHGLKSFGKVFKAIFKTVAGLAKVLMPILSDLATIVGTLAQGLMTIFGSTTGRIFVGMIAFNRVIKALNTSTGRLAMNWAAVLGTITEIIALFTRGYVGVTELALGGDLALGEMEVFQKLGEIFNDDGLVGEASRTIITYLPLILIALAAIRTAILATRWTRGIFGRIGKSGSKAAETTTKTATKSGSTKVTPTGKETGRHGHGGKTASTASQASKLELLLRSGGLARLLGLAGAGLELVANSKVYSNKEDMLAELSDSRARLNSFMESFKLNPASSAIFDRLQEKSTIIEKQENHITVPAGTTSEQVQFLRDEWDRIMMNNAVQ